MEDKKLVEAMAIDNIINPNSMENVYLYDEEGKKHEFEQLAFVEYKENFYTILKPVILLEGMVEGEALVLRIVNVEDKAPYLELEENEKTAEAVASIYLQSIEETKKQLDSKEEKED